MHRNLTLLKIYFQKFGNFFQKIKIIEFENQKKIKFQKMPNFPPKKMERKMIPTWVYDFLITMVTCILVIP
jgi:hypothetical protein